MAAVAVRQIGVGVRQGEVAGVSGARPVRCVKRRRKSRSRKLMRIVIPIFMVAAFLYIGLYAGVTAASYSKTRLTTLCRQERIRNERLTVELIRRSSPENVMAAAQKAGMVCATRYDYLRKPATVASSADSR